MLAACQHNRTGLFTVSGKVLHAPGNKLLLEELPFGGKNPIVVDSIAIRKDSSFELKSIAKEEGLYQLVIQDGPAILLINDASNVQVTLDIDNYKAYTTKGSEASTQLHEFLDTYSKEYQNLLTDIKQNDSIQVAKTTDSIRTVIAQQKDNQLQKINELVSNTVTNSNSAALDYYLLGKSFATMQPAGIKKLSDEAATRFTNHSGIAYMKEIVDGVFTRYQKQKQEKALLLQNKADSIAKKDSAGK
jgi:hypothetical protein